MEEKKKKKIMPNDKQSIHSVKALDSGGVCHVEVGAPRLPPVSTSCFQYT